MIGIIDGYTGEENVFADIIGEYNVALFGDGDYVLKVGERLGYSIVSNNEIDIKDGVFIMQGRRGHIKKGTTEVCRIENGSQSLKRNDMIVIEYSVKGSTMVESFKVKVVKGTESESAVDPETVSGDIRNGAILHQMPIYRVRIEGINIVAVEQVFEFGSVAGLKECFQSVSDGKTLVASAITGKRVPTDAAATFAQMAANILKIVLGSGNALAEHVLFGKTFTNDDGVEYAGTMPNQGAKNASLNCGGSYTIPAGYHNGSGKVTANSLASQTSATAVASQITQGYTAWVNGVKITGTRPAAVKSLSGSFTAGCPTDGTKDWLVNFSSPFDTVPSVSFTEDIPYVGVSIASVTNTSIIFHCYSEPGTSFYQEGTITWTATA